MSLYRVSCNMRSERDWEKVIPVSAEGMHPDLAKQKLLAMYPRHLMENIHIQDLTPTKRKWDDKSAIVRMGTSTKGKEAPIDLDRTWRKELAR